MRPFPSGQQGTHQGLCAIIYNSFLLAGILSWAIAQSLKPFTSWCAFDMLGLPLAVSNVQHLAMFSTWRSTAPPRTGHSPGRWVRDHKHPPRRRRTTKKWDWALVLSSGGMPSSHTAIISGVTAAIGTRDGLDSPLFALALVMVLIVAYDATSVRRAAGSHAAVLNALRAELPVHHPANAAASQGEQLRASLGHTPVQVAVGGSVGLFVGVIVQTIMS